ncbi:MAG: hypothetical protein KKH72_06095 [Alphaproteobacteria bacterium]|nr:hypothetical protein [Alphaproteobacteria bacterium]
MRLTDTQMLFAIRLVHTIIYVVNGTACFILLYAGITGRTGAWLWVALVLVAIETAVMLANGVKCPISPIADRYGARKDGFVYDVFIPTFLSRYTFEFFTVVVLLAGAFAGLRWIGLIG